ncbi:MAG: site-specific integrase [Deltaproteobacteria bacterium]|nr:site-specific integrase [Deltaproteobacteria bacterium]
MAKKISIKKYAGVYFTESTIRKWRERPDRCYWVAFKDAGKLIWERCGWASEGWTPEAAQRRRHELLEQDRAGEYKPKKERKADQLTFGELMEKHYLPWATQNKKHVLGDFSRYAHWLKARFASKALKNIAPLDLERLKREMREAGKSEATVKHVLCILRQAFNKALVWRLWLGENPCKGVSFPIPNNARQRFLSQAEAAQVLESLRLRSDQVAQIATMSLYGGLRLGEVLGLTWGNVDFANGIVFVQDTKNKESRPIFITEPIKQILGELTPGAPDELLFKTKAGNPVQQLSKSFAITVKELKLNEGVSDPRERVSFHTLRHTYASWAVMAGVPIYIVGKSIGHKTMTMTERYAHLAPESHRAAFEAVAQSGKTNGNTLRVISLEKK